MSVQNSNVTSRLLNIASKNHFVDILQEKEHISEFLNDTHDGGSVHASYMERLLKIKQKLDTGKYAKDGSIDWNALTSSFVSVLFGKIN